MAPPLYIHSTTKTTRSELSLLDGKGKIQMLKCNHLELEAKSEYIIFGVDESSKNKAAVSFPNGFKKKKSR